MTLHAPENSVQMADQMRPLSYPTVLSDFCFPLQQANHALIPSIGLQQSKEICCLEYEKRKPLQVFAWTFAEIKNPSRTQRAFYACLAIGLPLL